MIVRLLPIGLSLLLVSGLTLCGCQPITPPPIATVVESTSEPVSTPTPSLSLIEEEFTSDALAGNLLGDPATRKYVVYLPPSYTNGEGAYPVVYALHGFTGNQWTMSEFVETLDRLILAGDVPEMIAVMPDASNKYLGSFYMNSATIGGYETYITQELVSWVDDHYRTLPQPESRGITGCSMGGLGAARLGLAHPEVYGVVAGVSGPYLQAYHGLMKIALAQIETIPQTPDELTDQPFPVHAAYAIAAAAAPNPDNPPFYLDIPFEEVDGQILFAEEVFQRMGGVYANTAIEGEPVRTTQSQIVMIYHGNADPLAEVEGAITFTSMLNEHGIATEYVEVDGGGHCDLDYAPVAQFFGQHLVFEPVD